MKALCKILEALTGILIGLGLFWYVRIHPEWSKAYIAWVMMWAGFLSMGVSATIEAIFQKFIYNGKG